MNRSIPSLDGLRAISITFVLLAHLTGTKHFPALGASLGLPRFGSFGVRVFFIISGYLITSILLNELDRTGTINLRKFYFRRTMRLIPAAFAMIILVSSFTSVPRIDVLAALTYTMNYRFGLTSLPSWNLGHLWSLSVEEQFYLLWPFGLCLLGKSRSMKLLAGCLLLAPLARFAMYWGWLGASVQFLIYSDALATGCLLSLLRTQLWDNRIYHGFLASRWFYIVPMLAIGLNYVPVFKLKYVESFVNLAVALTIDWAIRNYRSPAGRMLNFGPIRVVGVLSYSLYLWQEVFLNRGSASVACSFPCNILLLCAAAAASYYWVEKPFLGLREQLEQDSFLAVPEGSLDRRSAASASLR